LPGNHEAKFKSQYFQKDKNTKKQRKTFMGLIKILGTSQCSLLILTVPLLLTGATDKEIEQVTESPKPYSKFWALSLFHLGAVNK
jgi:hypothetical protein